MGGKALTVVTTDVQAGPDSGFSFLNQRSKHGALNL